MYRMDDLSTKDSSINKFFNDKIRKMKEFVKEEELFLNFFSKHLLKTITISEITDQSIFQVINSSMDVLTSDASQQDLIAKFEDAILDPKQMDLIVFGTNQVIAALETGHLKEIYILDKSGKKDSILKSDIVHKPDTKLKMHIIKSNEFISKYGELVGIRHYAQYYEDFSDDNDNDNANDNDDVDVNIA